VLLLCALAALRVFLFSAAFPSSTTWTSRPTSTSSTSSPRPRPTGFEPIDADAAEPSSSTGPRSTHAGRGSRRRRPRRCGASRSIGSGWPSNPRGPHRRGRESRVHPAPLYYAVAGAWYRLGGRSACAAGGLYWIRFLNVLVAALLVWLAYGFARLSSRDGFLRLGYRSRRRLPAGCLYPSITTSSCARGRAALLALLVLAGRRAGLRLPRRRGLAVAAAVLVKPASAPILVVAVAAVLMRCAGTRRGRLAAAGRGAVLLLAAAAPLATWGARNLVALGDATDPRQGAALGWTLKPRRRSSTILSSRPPGRHLLAGDHGELLAR